MIVQIVGQLWLGNHEPLVGLRLVRLPEDRLATRALLFRHPQMVSDAAGSPGLLPEHTRAGDAPVPWARLRLLTAWQVILAVGRGRALLFESFLRRARYVGTDVFREEVPRAAGIACDLHF
jgi:hypothetical protein